jgi:two-component system OmpR family sensor kinase
MSLRLRLALGLAVLLALGFGAFGVATYSFYAPSVSKQLDTVLKSSSGFVAVDLAQKAHLPDSSDARQRQTRSESGDHGASASDSGHNKVPRASTAPSALLAPGSYGELVGPSGKVIAKEPIIRSVGVPRIPGNEIRPFRNGGQRFFDTRSVGPGPSWRVLVTEAPGHPGYLVALAAPTTNVDHELNELVAIEILVALALLLILLVGAYMVLRKGLRPLEHMAEDAHAIAEGDLARRVGPSKGATEVVELGSALNTMLAQIQQSFAERDATEARLRRFLADVSHELRTPLTSILGFAELFRLSEQGEKDLDPATMARRIEDEAGRMRRLVNDLMLLARLDQAPELEHEEVDLAVVTSEACSSAVAAEPGRPITLSASELVVAGDKDHIHRAVTNLLANAIAHTPPGSPIEVSVRREDQSAVVVVRDHGPGLDDEALKHAFDRFWRADIARAGEGSGLGLAIVNAIATEHGGSLRAGNATGGGAEFVLCLPIVSGARPEALMGG